jgi:hypothetical protein
VRRDPIVMGQRLLDEPRRVQVGFTVERVLKERPDVHLTVHLAVAANVVLIDECFVSSWVVQANEVPSKGIALDRAIRTPDHGEFGLFADGARADVAVHESDKDLLAWEEFAFELVVNPVDCKGGCQYKSHARPDGRCTYQARPCDRRLRIGLCEGSGRVGRQGRRVRSPQDSGSDSGVSRGTCRIVQSETTNL